MLAFGEVRRRWCLFIGISGFILANPPGPSGSSKRSRFLTFRRSAPPQGRKGGTRVRLVVLGRGAPQAGRRPVSSQAPTRKARAGDGRN